MLFKAKITHEVAKDREKLAEQLYLFLNEFAYTRLKYESKDTVEDCIQDTIMYMIDRFNSLEENKLDGINLEKYFYNRANSYISYWLKGKANERKKFSKYVENSLYVSSLKGDYANDREPKELIDFSLLQSIVDKYPFNEQDKKYIAYEASNRLQELGFIGDDWVEQLEEIARLATIINAVVDEYLVMAVGYN